MNHQQLYTKQDFAALPIEAKREALHYVSPTLAEVGKHGTDFDLIDLYQQAANTDSVPIVAVVMAPDGKHLALGEPLHPLPELPIDARVAAEEFDLINRVSLDMYVTAAETRTVGFFDPANHCTMPEILLEVSRRQKLNLPTPTKEEIEARWKVYCEKRNTELGGV